MVNIMTSLKVYTLQTVFDLFGILVTTWLGILLVLISPKDKFRFLHDLAATAEDLEVRDECVVRRH